MKALFRHLDWGPGTKGSHSDPADKTFLGLHVVSNVSKWSKLLLKSSAAGSCSANIDLGRKKYFLSKKNSCEKCYHLKYLTVHFNQKSFQYLSPRMSVTHETR